MKLCAVTMVYRDYWALSQWYRHYGAMLGPKHLYIVAHGDDPKIKQMCPDASIVTIPRDDLTGFDRKRGRMLNAFQAGLLQTYDWVIRTDTDELICTDPALEMSVPEVISAQDAPALFALGFNLVEMNGDAAMVAGSVFKARHTAVFSGHYSKAFAVSEPVALMRHGVQLKPRRVTTFPFEMPPGLYLVHLKFANRAALTDANQHRIAVARAPGKGLPGPAWQNAETESDDFLARVEDMPLRSWEDGSLRAYNKLSQRPLRDANEKLVRARTMRFKYRVHLPDGFGAYL